MNIFSKVLEEQFKFTPSETEESRWEKVYAHNNKYVANVIEEFNKNGSMGDLDFSFIKFTEVPDTLKYVDGNLIFSHNGFPKLPNNLKVEGSMEIKHCSITELPENLTVAGKFHIMVTNIKSLPKSLTVDGELILGYVQIGDQITDEYAAALDKEKFEKKMKRLYPNIRHLQVWTGAPHYRNITVF